MQKREWRRKGEKSGNEEEMKEERRDVREGKKSERKRGSEVERKNECKSARKEI